MPLKKIVSGGQTGVDRAALDAALAAQFPCGGWVTADRMAEDGVIDARYPLIPLPHILINAAELPDPIVASAAVFKFAEGNNIETLNVAGPRLSGWTAGYAFSLKVVGQVIHRIR
jgi:hypothetical protein